MQLIWLDGQSVYHNKTERNDFVFLVINKNQNYMIPITEFSFDFLKETYNITNTTMEDWDQNIITYLQSIESEQITDLTVDLNGKIIENKEDLQYKLFSVDKVITSHSPETAYIHY